MCSAFSCGHHVNLKTPIGVILFVCSFVFSVMDCYSVQGVSLPLTHSMLENAPSPFVTLNSNELVNEMMMNSGIKVISFLAVS